MFYEDDYIYEPQILEKSQKSQPSVGFALGVFVGAVGTAFYLSKYVTDKATYESCKNGVANLIKEYQNTKKQNQTENQQSVPNQLTDTPTVQKPNLLLVGTEPIGTRSLGGVFVDKPGNAQCKGFYRFGFKNVLNELLRVALLFLMVLLIVHLLRILN